MIDRERIERFVESYARDLGSGDGDRIAGNYDVPALMVMNPVAAGVAVTDLNELAPRFSAASKLYLDHGFGDPRGLVSRVEPVTDHVVFAWVNWDYRDTDGASLYDADYVYALRDSGARLTITAVFSVNESDRLTTWLETRSAAR